MDYLSAMKTKYRRGREEGMAEGEARGRAKRNLEIVKWMIDSGLSYEQISSFAGLLLYEIKELTK